MDIKFYFVCLMLYMLGALPTALSQVIFEDDFESGALKTEWTAIPGADYGVVEVASTKGAQKVYNKGTYGVAMGKDIYSGGLLTNQLELKLDLSDYSEVELSFYLFNNNDETHPEDGLFFSDNGGANYKKVMDFDFSNWTASNYEKLPPIDIDRLAKHHGLSLSADFVIKFQQHGTRNMGDGYASQRDGFFLDDVLVKVPDRTYISTFPYETGFEGSIELPAGWKQGNPTFPYISPEINSSTAVVEGESTVRIEGTVAVSTTVNTIPAFKSGSNGLALGKTIGGVEGAVAADLHLDLSKTPDVELTFWMKNNFDETSTMDGIYFSDNGGETFTKVMEFDGTNWSNDEWGKLPPLDIDRLAKNYGLSLTSSFVIRFQQYGKYPFRTSTSASTRDGIFIDDVEVRVPDNTYISTFPYKTGFEGSVELPAGWKQGNPTFPYISPKLNNSTAVVEEKSTVRLESTVSVVATINTISAFHSGSNGLAIGKTAGGINGAVAADLHLDLSKTPDVELSFWMKNNYNESSTMDGIYFSDNGGETFTKVMEFDGTNWSNDEWGKLPPLDIDRLAKNYGLSLTSSFVIRFQQYGKYPFRTSTSASTRDGIFIDDVEVRVPDNTYISTFPYKTGFEGSVELPAGWKQGNPTFPYISPKLNNSTAVVEEKSTVRLESTVSVVATINTISAFHSGSNGLAIGKTAGGINGAVAADLHLDLSKTPDVELSFWMKNNYNESSTMDGIYFSDDAGVTFTKVMDLDGDNWANSEWGQLPPLDIDRLAKYYGLSLTATFIIRFQQYGKYPFRTSTSATTRDGIFIDDLEVRVPDQTFIKDFPYKEGFENGDNLPNGWAYSNPTFPYTEPLPEFSTGLVDNKSTVRLEGAVGVTDKYQSLTVSNSGNNGLYLGKSASGEFGVVSTDLKLNLKEAQNVILKFEVFSSYEEQHPQNGIYLSVDEGLTFTKIQEYTFNSNKWTAMEVDISTLAEEKELILSEKTVVRFQQYGSRAIYTSSSSRDGIFLDDIEITTKSRINQVISFSPLPDMQFGDAPFDLSATADSDLPVQFTVVSGPASITGTQLTITGTGTVKIKAEQVGDNEYDAAEAVEQSFEVEKANQEITFGSISKKTYGDAPFTLVASADSKLPVTFSLVGGPATLSGSKVTITGAGTITVKATQNGNDNYNATSEEKEITVEKAGQTITFATLPDKIYGDAPVDLSATSSSGLTVTFTVKSGPGSLSGKELSLDGAGAIVVTASQSGNDNYKAASEVNRTQTVNKKSQSIEFTAIGDKVVGSEPFDLSASSSSDLEVTFEVVSGPATISGKTVSLTGAGKVVIEASQNGNDNYAAAEEKTNSFCVAPPVPEIEIIGSEFSPELVLKVKNAPAGSTFQWQLDGADISGADQSEISLTAGGAYTVRVTVDGCSSVSEPQTLTALGERPSSGGLVKLFPNPATSSFSIEGLTVGETYELTINDVNGKSRVELEYQHKDNNFIDISGFNAGVYLIEIQGYRVFVVRRLIINH
ncbi:T9SS type A sorting domain-containing protein [uncultured Cyclobacterium sp.]|uniref:T9SS type A sorting domain-containing protein n=1 Tax=uncultured Cyclobacterium sp. TaxID=453820 RepID=UPI0030EDD4CC